MEQTSSPDSPPAPGYETSDAPARPVAMAGLAIVVATVVVGGLLYWMIGVLEGDRPERFSVAEARRGEDTFINIYAQLRQLHADEADTLDRYAYDGKSGVVRIPIDRAMDLIAERGVPKGKGPKTDVQLNSRETEKK